MEARTVRAFKNHLARCINEQAMGGYTIQVSELSQMGMIVSVDIVDCRVHFLCCTTP